MTQGYKNVKHKLKIAFKLEKENAKATCAGKIKLAFPRQASHKFQIGGLLFQIL
jgi:hypothetical protein